MHTGRASQPKVLSNLAPTTSHFIKELQPQSLIVAGGQNKSWNVFSNFLLNAKRYKLTQTGKTCNLIVTQNKCSQIIFEVHTRFLNILHLFSTENFLTFLLPSRHHPSSWQTRITKTHNYWEKVAINRPIHHLLLLPMEMWA